MVHFYNIHTHRLLPPVENCRQIVNRIVGIDKVFPEEKKLSCGIHPWHIQDANAQLEELKSRLDTFNNIVAIGEAGLDKLHSPVSLLQQQEIFHQQALLAEEYEKPLIIHCVKAWEEIIREKKSLRPSVPWIIHGFRGRENWLGNSSARVSASLLASIPSCRLSARRGRMCFCWRRMKRR